MRVHVKRSASRPFSSCCECQRATFASFSRIICPLRQLAFTERFVLHPETRAGLLLHTLLSVVMMWDLKVWPLMSFWSGFCVRTHVATTTFDRRSDFPPPQCCQNHHILHNITMKADGANRPCLKLETFCQINVSRRGNVKRRR